MQSELLVSAKCIVFSQHAASIYGFVCLFVKKNRVSVKLSVKCLFFGTPCVQGIIFFVYTVNYSIFAKGNMIYIRDRIFYVYKVKYSMYAR